MSAWIGSKHHKVNGGATAWLYNPEQIARSLGKAKRAGANWVTNCPAHDDRNASLSIGQGEDGKLLVKCHAGCSQDAVIEAMRRRGAWPDSPKPEPGKKSPPRRPPEPRPRPAPPEGAETWQPIVPPPVDAPKPDLSGCISFEYVGADGRLLFYQRRFEKPDGGKKFGQLTFGLLNGKRDWHDRGPAQPFPLYRLDRITTADPNSTVLVVEGEKACQAAERLFPDFVVTTWLNGAGSVHLADWSPLRRFKRVIWWEDADRPREKPHGRFLATPAFLKLFPAATVIDTVGLADIEDGYDAADLEQGGCDDPDAWLAARLKLSELADVFQWSSDAWEIAAIPQRPWLAPPYLMRGEITLLHGPGGASKSLLQVYWAIACVLGQPFGRLDPRGPVRALLLNFEDNADEQMRRISAALDCFSATPRDLVGKLRRVSLGKLCDATMFRLDERGTIATTQAWDALIWHCETFKPDVVFLDPLIAINAAGESDNSIMRRVMTMLRTAIAVQFNCTLILAHHDSKGGGDDTANDQNNARGAGDIVNAARFELAVKNMTTTQAEAFGLDAENRKHYFRVGSEDSKRNYAAPEAAEWFERMATLINGESVVRCDPWTPPDGKLSEDQATRLLAEIARGTSAGPYSPQLGKNNRSLSPTLEALGIAGDKPQRRALRDLKDRHGVESVSFKRPGHGSNIRQGLRTPSGAPHNCQWCNGEDMEATE